MEGRREGRKEGGKEGRSVFVRGIQLNYELD